MAASNKRSKETLRPEQIESKAVCRIVLVILIGLFCCGPTVNSVAQTRKIDSPEVLKALLALPAPIPRHAAQPAPPNPYQSRPPEFFQYNNPPPDDAPIEDLMAYWERWADTYGNPTDAVRQRLFEAVLSNPKSLAALVNALPDNDKVPAKVKDIYDRALADPEFDKDWREKVRKWLVLNSTYFLDELVALAQKAKDNEKNGDVEKEAPLTALAKVSWTNAEPLLRGLIASGQPRATALAVSLFYRHAVDEKNLADEERYRRDLKAIAANRSMAAAARDTAIQALSATEWSGLDEWYLSLFQDETLINPEDGEYSLTPLQTLFSADPEKWIPIMAKLVESKDLTVRSAAASCLVSIETPAQRKKALAPLLPWLMNPAWANDNSNHRIRLIQSLGNAELPESVPGLISVVENDDSPEGGVRGYAAQSLAEYKDPRAVPALKRALTKERNEIQRQRLMRGLLASHGLSEMEQLEALETFAAKLTTPDGRTEMFRYRSPQEEPLPPTLSIGRYLGQSRQTPSETLVEAVLARADHLRTENPALSEALLEIAQQWQGRQIEFDIIRRIANGSADTGTISEALQRKQKMLEGLRTELQGLSSIAGAAQGVGAVLLEDPALAQEILTSEDQPAQIALLLCSRITQTPLPVQMVAPFLTHKNSLLALAAETYLLAEDSREARELLWRQHPNEAFITGWRESLMYGGIGSEALTKTEEKLRAELLKENGPTEIVAFVGGFEERGTVLRIYADKAIYTEIEDAARYRETTVPKSAVSAFKDFLTVNGIADRGPTIQYCHHGCPTSELLTLTREKGRRVYNRGGWEEWQQIQEEFVKLTGGVPGKIHYKLEDDIKGLEVLYAGDLSVNDVWQQGGELRIFVERPETQEEKEEREATYMAEGDDDDDEAKAAERARRRIELANARFSWRVFANEKVGAVTSEPDVYTTFDETKFMLGNEDDEDWEGNYEHQTQVISADSIIVARGFEGLWRQFAGGKPSRLGSETASYDNPIVSRDGKWVVVSKSETESGIPYHIVRINLQTGREFRVNLAPSDYLAAIAFLPSQGKVLVRRAKEQYVAPDASPSERPEHYLLDPATGAFRSATGNFTVLEQVGDRFLQATEKPDEFWAAIPDDKKTQTQIGRYSLKDFSFKPLLTVPQLMFNSMSMWVDAGQGKVYLVYKGQLLRLPLQSTAK